MQVRLCISFPEVQVAEIHVRGWFWLVDVNNRAKKRCSGARRPNAVLGITRKQDSRLVLVHTWNGDATTILAMHLRTIIDTKELDPLVPPFPMTIDVEQSIVERRWEHV